MVFTVFRSRLGLVAQELRLQSVPPSKNEFIIIIIYLCIIINDE